MTIDADTATVHVLVVEDSPPDARKLQRVLQQWHHNVRVSIAPTGPAALEHLINTDTPLPNLILLDLHLPGMHGLAVLQAIKGDLTTRHIPVLILTGSTDPDDIRHCYDANANAYLVKPSGVAALAELSQRIEAFWIESVKTP